MNKFPLQHSFTAANVNDVAEGIKLPIERGATYVFDKGYCDYNWWANIDAQHARFVTRFKYNAALRVETSRPIAAADRCGRSRHDSGRSDCALHLPASGGWQA
jgi:putative transposase